MLSLIAIGESCAPSGKYTIAAHDRSLRAKAAAMQRFPYARLRLLIAFLKF